MVSCGMMLSSLIMVFCNYSAKGQTESIRKLSDGGRYDTILSDSRIYFDCMRGFEIECVHGVKCTGRVWVVSSFFSTENVIRLFYWNSLS